MDLTKSAEKYMDHRLKELQRLRDKGYIIIDDIDDPETSEDKAKRMEILRNDLEAWISYYFPKYKK